jgi:hypothetical protein
LVTNGGTVTATSVVTESTGEIRGNANIVGNVQNGGTVSPGTSVGALNFVGDYTQTTNGELLIELGSASSFDQLLVSENADLGGTLKVELIDGYIPTGSESFTILTSDDVGGTFGTEILPVMPNLEFDVIYNPNSVVVTVTSVGLPGDYNYDGMVDAADYVFWRKTGGSPDDYNTWRENFARTLSGSGSSQIAALPVTSAIPEPTTPLLLLSFKTIAIWRHRRGCH